MGEFHINKQTDYLNAYKKFTDYMISEYDFLCNEIIEALSCKISATKDKQ